MRVTLTITLILALVATTIPFTAKFWPRSYEQELALLWLNEDDWLHLLDLAKKTPYTNIVWAKSEFAQAGIRTKDGIRWELEPEIGELTSAAEEVGISAINFQYYSGHWTISGLPDGWFSSSNPAKMISVNSYYQYGGKLVGKKCSTEVIEAENSGLCHKSLFGDWVLYKEWITTPNPLYGSNE